MRARVLASCVCAVACASAGPALRRADKLPTLTHPRIKPGERLRLVGVWGRDVWSGYPGAEAVAFMPDGKTAVAAGNEIVVFDVATRSPLRRFKGHPHGIGSVAVSPDGRTIATGGFIDHTVVFWDAATGARLRAIVIPEDRSVSQTVTALAYSPDGRHIVVACHGLGLAVYDAASGATVWTGGLPLGPAGPDDATYSPDGKLIAGAGADGIAVFDAVTGQQLWAAQERANGVAFQQGELVAVGQSPEVVIYDARTGAVKARREERGRGHVDPRSVAAVPSRPGVLIIGEYDSAVTIRDERRATSMYGHLDGLVGVAVSHDGRYAVSVALADGVRVWDLARRSEAPLDSHDGEVVALGPSADGTRLTSIGSDGSILVRSVATGAILSRREGPRAPVIAAAFSADGDVAVISSEAPQGWPDETGLGLHLVDARTGRLRGELELRLGPASTVALSADGHAAVAVAGDLCARYDLTNLTATTAATATATQPLSPPSLDEIHGVKAEIQDVALLPGGDVAVVSGTAWRTWHDGDIVVNGIVGRVRMPEGKLVSSLDGGVMTRLAVTRDGAVALTGDRSGTVRLVDLRSGKLLWPMSLQWKGTASAGGESAILAVALSPDGRFAAAADAGGTLRVWNVDSGLLYDMLALPTATALAFAPDSRSLYAGAANGIVFRFAL